MEFYYLWVLLVLLVVTRLCAEIAERVGQPALVGEIFAGIILGLIAGQTGVTEDRVVIAIADLGIFFLMLLAGLEMRPEELVQASGRAVAVAAGGMVLPLALGFGLAWVFLPDSGYKLVQALFVGVALAITAVPVAVKILLDLDALHSPAGRLIVSAAVFDDVFSLVLLAVVLALVATGEFPSLLKLALLGLQIAAFFAVTIAIGRYLLPYFSRVLHHVLVREFHLSSLLMLALAYALLAELLNLHFILGAFMAGLFYQRRIAGEATYDDLMSKLSGVTMGFFAPVFFAYIGLHINLAALTEIPLFLGLLLLFAFIGKALGAGLPAWLLGLDGRHAAAVGIAMSARGAVELVIAGVALRAGLFAVPEPPPPIVAHLFSAIVLMAIVTTLVAPIGLKAALPRSGPE